jgi:hypothetical protein
LTGLFCHTRRLKGAIIKTKEVGFLYVQDLEDLGFAELAQMEKAAK